MPSDEGTRIDDALQPQGWKTAALLIGRDIGGTASHTASVGLPMATLLTW